MSNDRQHKAYSQAIRDRTIGGVSLYRNGEIEPTDDGGPPGEVWFADARIEAFPDCVEMIDSEHDVTATIQMPGGPDRMSGMHRYVLRAAPAEGD